MNIKIDTELSLPIYRQISNSITADIKSGQMQAGTKLPTVRELADSLNVARGTVKRAYDELEKSGIISKSRGRGSFVSHTEQSSESRKEKAMQAIDGMLDTLESLKFSPGEVSIFLDLKMRQRVQRDYVVSIAAVECCIETQLMLRQSLQKLEGVDVLKSDLYEMLADPETFHGSTDLVVTSSSHFEQVAPLAPSGKVMQAAMELTPASIAAISRLGRGRIGVLARSEKFAALAASALGKYASSAQVVVSKVTGDGSPLDALLGNIDILALPAGFYNICSARDEQLIKSFAREHSVVEIAYRVDEGSMLYISGQVKALQLRKRR